MILHHAPPASDRRRLFLAMPSYGAPSAVTAFSLFEAARALDAAGIDTEFALLVGHCHVDDARNLLVAKFLDSAADELMFIDADMGWQPHELVAIAAADRDVVGASYRLKKDESEFPCQFRPGEIWSDEDGLIEVNALPTGFLKIHRRVFERLAERSRVYRPDARAEPVREFFFRWIDPTSQLRVSGDYHFCHRWRACGGAIYVNPEVNLLHSGPKLWDGSLGSHLRVKAGLELAPFVAALRAGTETDADIVKAWEEWGGNQWAAGHELLKVAIQFARQAKGPIIEVGSGLTSVAMAAAGAEVWALEHDETWLAKLLRYRERFGLDRLHAMYRPLEPSSAGAWYGNASDLPWQTCDIVLCDGPPFAVGNRLILWDRMREYGAEPRAVLVDDASEYEADGYEFERMGHLRSFMIGRRREKAEAA